MTQLIITCTTPADYERVLEAIIRGACRAETDRLGRLPEKLREEENMSGQHDYTRG